MKWCENSENTVAKSEFFGNSKKLRKERKSNVHLKESLKTKKIGIFETILREIYFKINALFFTQFFLKISVCFCDYF